MNDKQAYVNWHKERMNKECFVNLTSTDIFKLEYDYVQHNLNSNGVLENYSLFGYKLVRFGNAYYVYSIKENHNDPNAEFMAHLKSIDEVNGFICGMYKAYHNRFTFEG